MPRRKNKNHLTLVKRPKVECEICGEKDSSILERHHIVERTEAESTNHDFNLSVICPSCHSKVHSGSIKILGVLPGTKGVTGRTLVYIKDGVCNVPGVDKEYFNNIRPKPKSMKIPGSNESK